MQSELQKPSSEGKATASCDDPNDIPSPRLAMEADDIFQVAPLAALQLLCASVELLVRITGDVPPTPPLLDAPKETIMREMEAEKASIVRTLSESSLARLREQGGRQSRSASRNANTSTPAQTQSRLPPTPPPARPIQIDMEIDGVHLRTSSRTRIPEPAPLSPAIIDPDTVTPPAEVPFIINPEPYIIIGADSQPLNVQHSAIARKFYSKAVPPFGITQYLMRLHRYCPMSTAVYLATSLYIYRLAVVDKVIAVTRRNSHRLVLAGVRVAMKALEDRNHSHAKMSKVGGVSESELARLEINFCFLVGFQVSVHAEEIQQHWTQMKSGQALGMLDMDETAAVTAVLAKAS